MAEPTELHPAPAGRGNGRPPAPRLQSYICATCGVQYQPLPTPPAVCAICLDERQYVPPSGQAWTTMPELSRGFHNRFRELEPGLFEIVTEPAFGIGQRALLVQSDHGNLLWDCLTLVDQDTVRTLQRLGGVAAIAISHPHFYGACTAWSEALGNPPVWLPLVDRGHLMYPHRNIRHFLPDRVEPVPGLSVVRVGGHFHGSTLLHWPAGAGGRGVLLTGDTIAVVADRRHVTFLYSYPNRIPLGRGEVARIAGTCGALAFERLYGGFPGDNILTAARDAVLRSAQRYCGMLDGSWPRR